MTKKYSELRGMMSPESRARAKAHAEDLLREMALADLRRARDLTQQQLASSLNVNQAWISKVERQTDMYVSTLRSYVEALGGDLEIVVRFPDSAIKIGQFENYEVLERNATPAKIAAELGLSNTNALRNPNLWLTQVPDHSVIRDGGVLPTVWKTNHVSTTGRQSTQTTPGSRTEAETTKAA